jgi:hypothetical protein
MIANIGPRERRKRLLFGIVLLAGSLLLAAILIRSDVPRSWRMLLAIPLWAAGLGLFQARAKT